MAFKENDQKQSSKQILPEVNVQKSIVELCRVASDQMMKYELFHPQCWKTVQEPFIGTWKVTSNHQVYKYWADLLFLVKNIMWDGSN